MTKLYGTLLCSVLLSFGCARDDPPRGSTTPENPPSAKESALGASDRPPRILFLGTSLTAGLGVGRDQAYPAHIERRIRDRGWRFEVVNAGVSGDTSAGGLSRLEWLLRDTVDVLVLELGANDGLRGLAVDAMERNLRTIIQRTRERYPDVDVLLAGMRMPPNLGRDYTRAYEMVFPRLAESEDAVLIPFLLAGVGGEAAFNQADGVHPNARGHAAMAETVWTHLEPVLEAMAGSREPA